MQFWTEAWKYCRVSIVESNYIQRPLNVLKILFSQTNKQVYGDFLDKVWHGIILLNKHKLHRHGIKIVKANELFEEE